jgi:four helix bundle protein
MLVAYTVSLDVARKLAPVVAQVRKHDGNLATQMRRAMSSTILNLSEGAAHVDGNKKVKYRIAYGEAQEVRAALDLASVWSYVHDDREVRADLNRLLALCYGLVHGKRRPG